MAIKISRLATVSERAIVMENVSVWDFSKVREDTLIDSDTVIGDYVYIDVNVKVGKNCKIQNAAMLYGPCILHDGVFIGPGVVLTNDHHPRAILPTGKKKSSLDWEKVGVEILSGATIGANSVCVAPIKIGRWSMIGAGSVITKDVPDFAIIVGNPGRQIGWVGKAGRKLHAVDDFIFSCPITKQRYKLENGTLKELENK
jgi:UDP-2-acetamido-3-amino-2,3-dideoxy-glucuronate N-acetyltransferase